MGRPKGSPSGGGQEVEEPKGVTNATSTNLHSDLGQELGQIKKCNYTLFECAFKGRSQDTQSKISKNYTDDVIVTSSPAFK